MNRRHFMHTLSGALSAAALSSLQSGCTQSGATGSDGPVLGGDPGMPWWLRGNYAPVSDEIEAVDLEVTGAIPPELDGVFLRNGANPSSGASAHWFLGDGMLHGVRLSEGRALWYRNRWIETYARSSGAADNPAANRGNTNLIHHADKVLALYEVGLPHEINAMDLSTHGEVDFAGMLQGPMSAHPKIDSLTGALCFIGYSPVQPYLRYHEADEHGALISSRDISVPQPTMMHDFQLTTNYAVFLDFPVVFDLSALSSGFPFVWSPEAGTRIGLLRRDAPEADVHWFDIDTGFAFHTFNAYEDTAGRVVVEGCRLPSIWADSVTDAFQTPTPWRWTVDPSDGSSRESAFESVAVDFPIIDPRRQGQEHRMDYGLHLQGGSADYPTHPNGIIKHDRMRDETQIWHYGDTHQPDEALFVPSGDAEDAGWLLTMVYDRAEDRSEVHILDASEITRGPVARITMPRRVPFGFHGCWVPTPQIA